MNSNNINKINVFDGNCQFSGIKINANRAHRSSSMTLDSKYIDLHDPENIKNKLIHGLESKLTNSKTSSMGLETQILR